MQHGRKQIRKKTNRRKRASSLIALLIILAVGLCEPPTPPLPWKKVKKVRNLVFYTRSTSVVISGWSQKKRKEEKFIKKELDIVFFIFFLSIEEFWFWMWFN